MHGHHHDLNIPACDVIVCSGDISMSGGKNEVIDFFAWFMGLTQCEYKILVAGNHDLSFDPLRGGNGGTKPEWLRELIVHFETSNPGLNPYLENDSCEIKGVKFWGSPTSSWFHGDTWAFNVREKQAEDLYSTIPEGIDVLITHGPSLGCGDWCDNVSGPVGDKVLAHHIRRVKPLLHLFGHIHEAYGHEESVDSHHFNGSNCTIQYRIGNKPWLIDADFDNKEVEVLNERV